MYKRLLVPIDGSVTAERGFTEAIHLATAHDAQIRLLHVMPTAPAEREASEATLADFRRRAIAAGVAADVRSLDGFDGPLDDLIVTESEAWRADLIVMGTHGRTGLPRLLVGSEADRVVRLSRIPVLLVPGRDA